jgi:hypothetical protein
MGTTLRLRLPAPLTAEHVGGLCAALGEQLGSGTVNAVVCSVDRAAGDLPTVDALARLALVARRAGVAFSLDIPGAELSSLLRLVGLQAVLAGRSDDP